MPDLFNVFAQCLKSEDEGLGGSRIIQSQCPSTIQAFRAAAAKKQCNRRRFSLSAIATPVSNMLVRVSNLVIILCACRKSLMFWVICLRVLWQRVT